MWATGHAEEAVERMQAAFDVLSTEEQDEGVAWLAAQLGRVLYFTGRTADALDRVEDALEIAEALRLPEVLSQAMNTKGLVLGTRGRNEEGMALLRRSLEIALEHQLSAAALRAYNNLGAMEGQADRFEEVIRLSDLMGELARRTGDRPVELFSVTGAWEELFHLGRWDEVIARLGSVDVEEMASDLLRVNLANLVPLYANRGELDRAREVLAWLQELETSSDIQLRTTYTVMEAIVLRAEGRHEEALARAEGSFAARVEFGIRASQIKLALVESMEVAAELGDVAKLEELLDLIAGLRPSELTPMIQAQGARFSARLAAAHGDADRVDPGLLAAERGFAELSMPFARAVTQLEHGEWLLEVGRPDDALPLLADALSEFERLRAVPWIERTQRASERIGAEATA
jgi:tetratricopeptide (TPR) repeat protein